MDKLTLLSQDKATIEELRNFFKITLEKDIVAKTLAKEDVSGYAEANRIIKNALDAIDKLTKQEKKVINLNKSE